MRLLIAGLLVVSAFALVPSTTDACHMPLSQPTSGASAVDWNPFNSPDEPHKGPADVHWHECGDGHAWVCAHTARVDECVQTW